MNQELKEELEQLSGWNIPEHDVLEFLLGKLPPKIWNDKEKQWDGLKLFKWKYYDRITYTAEYWTRYYQPAISDTTDSPCDSLGELAIKLFKEGILTK